MARASAWPSALAASMSASRSARSCSAAAASRPRASLASSRAAMSAAWASCSSAIILSILRTASVARVSSRAALACRPAPVTLHLPAEPLPRQGAALTVSALQRRRACSRTLPSSSDDSDDGPRVFAAGTGPRAGPLDGNNSEDDGAGGGAPRPP